MSYGQNTGSSSKPVETGKEYTVDITDTGRGGDGIARIGCFVIFVKNAKIVAHNIGTMSQQQQLLKQELTISQILRTYSKQFTQITERYSDGYNGRCAMGVIWSYFGWDGRPDSDMTMSVKAALPTLAKTGLRDDFSIIELNDTGMSFDEIADYIDRIGNNRY